MKRISRRGFITGSAAVGTTLTPGLAAWFLRWFDSKKFWEFAEKKPKVIAGSNVSFYFDDVVGEALNDAEPGELCLIKPKWTSYADGEAMRSDIERALRTLAEEHSAPPQVIPMGRVIDTLGRTVATFIDFEAKIVDAKQGIISFKVPADMIARAGKGEGDV